MIGLDVFSIEHGCYVRFDVDIAYDGYEFEAVLEGKRDEYGFMSSSADLAQAIREIYDDITEQLAVGMIRIHQNEDESFKIQLVSPDEGVDECGHTVN